MVDRPVKVEFTGLKSLAAKYQNRQNLVALHVARAVNAGAADVQADAIIEIQTGSKTGITYNREEAENGKYAVISALNSSGERIPVAFIPTDAISNLPPEHTASAPGEAPATDTGNLVSLLVINTANPNDPNPIATVESGAPYSAILEFGSDGGKIEPRPFMGPAFDRNLPLIQAEVQKAIQKGLE